MDSKIRVLIVDDSAYIRQVLRRMLEQSPTLTVVGTARDGRDALEQVVQFQPDVVVLDLVMPEMDGVEFLRVQMARRPLPVIVVSVADGDSERALAALAAGAVECLQKPTALASEKIFEIADELIRTIHAVATLVPSRLLAPSLPVGAPLAAPVLASRQVDVVVIGVSTGGPHALRQIIPRLPRDIGVPLAMVLHMPIGYTEAYAQSLNKAADLEVREAENGIVVEAGVALLAPAGQHLSLGRSPTGRVVAHLSQHPLDLLHRPAVDVLFRSAAELYGARVLGVVLTGMGQDGLEGAAWIKAQGGLVFTEAEESCVVYGMPRAVAEAGISDRSVPLMEMAQAIMGVL